jgi:hypothetical protein
MHHQTHFNSNNGMINFPVSAGNGLKIGHQTYSPSGAYQNMQTPAPSRTISAPTSETTNANSSLVPVPVYHPFRGMTKKQLAAIQQMPAEKRAVILSAGWRKWSQSVIEQGFVPPDPPAYVRTGGQLPNVGSHVPALVNIGMNASAPKDIRGVSLMHGSQQNFSSLGAGPHNGGLVSVSEPMLHAQGAYHNTPHMTRSNSITDMNGYEFSVGNAMTGMNDMNTFHSPHAHAKKNYTNALFYGSSPPPPASMQSNMLHVHPTPIQARTVTPLSTVVHNNKRTPATPCADKFNAAARTNGGSAMRDSTPKSQFGTENFLQSMFAHSSSPETGFGDNMMAQGIHTPTNHLMGHGSGHGLSTTPLDAPPLVKISGSSSPEENIMPQNNSRNLISGAAIAKLNANNSVAGGQNKNHTYQVYQAAPVSTAGDMFSADHIIKNVPIIDYNINAEGLKRTDSVLNYSNDLDALMSAREMGIDMGHGGYGSELDLDVGMEFGHNSSHDQPSGGLDWRLF